MWWLYKVFTVGRVCLLSGRHDERQPCKSWLSQAKRPHTYYPVILCCLIPTWNGRTVPVKWPKSSMNKCLFRISPLWLEGAGWDNYFTLRKGSYCNFHLLFFRIWTDVVPVFTWIAASIFPLTRTYRFFPWLIISAWLTVNEGLLL